MSFTASIFSKGEVENWYQTLQRPLWTPRGFVFSIVWPILYAMIAISLWMVLTLPQKIQKSRALVAFGFQIGFNFTWSFSFFYMQSPLLGLINIVLLVAAIFWNLIEFYKVSRVSCYLLIPYFAWVLFAITLNFGFWILNR